MKLTVKQKVALNVLFLVTLVVILFVFVRHSLADIFEQLATTAPILLVSITVLGLVNQYFEGRGIRVMSRSLNKPLTTFQGSMTSCITAFYRVITFGAGTFIAEVNCYRQRGMRISEGIGVTVLRMTLYKIAVAFYALIGLAVYGRDLYALSPKSIGLVIFGVIATLFILIGLLTMALSLKLQVFFIYLADRFCRSLKMRHLVDRCNLQIYSLREAVQVILSDRKILWHLLSLNLIKLMAWYLIPYIVLMREHENLSFGLLFFLVSFATVLAGVIPAPAGIGSFEFAYLLLFQPVIGTVDAVASMLLYRFATYVLPFILGCFHVLREKRSTLINELHSMKENAEE